MDKDITTVEMSNDTSEDDQNAILLLKKYHSLIYHLFNSDHQWNMSVIQGHCTIPHNCKKQIMAATTAKESNERILTFLEDTFLQPEKYDEFFVIVQKLIEIPSALPIIEKMQKELNSTFNRRAMVKTSATKELHHHDDGKTKSAKSIMTNMIAKTLCSIPGYYILESNKDCICSNLPADYNNTAVRLQTLIGASDHMIQWILTGDMSKVNHRIYQVVLVYVCFEPHFIKFCDIMEVLAAGSITVGCIVELRITLIKQLYTDGHITAEEAAELSTKKLFEVPAAISPFHSINTIDSITVATVTSRNFNTESVVCTRTVKTTTYTTFSMSTSLNNTSASVSVPCTAILDVHSRTINTANSVNTSNVEASDDITCKEGHAIDTMTTFRLKNICNANGRNIPHCINSSEISNMRNSEIKTKFLTAHDVQENISIKGPSSVAKDLVSIPGSHVASVHEDDEKPSCALPQTESSSAGVNIDCQSILLSTNNDIVHANSETSYVSNSNESMDNNSNTVLSTSSLCEQTESVITESSIIVNSENSILATAPTANEVSTAFLEEQSPIVIATTSNDTNSVKIVPIQARSRTQLEASEDNILNEDQDLQVAIRPKVHSTMHPDPGTDANTVEFGSKEVYDVLNRKDFAIVKDKYVEILSCFPENFEGTISCLQNHLSDDDICKILSLTTGQNQKLLNFLILRLIKSKEGLLDFCDSLEKISAASPSLKNIAEQLRKEAIAMISNLRDLPSTTQAIAAHPAKPPRKIIPLHANLLEAPDVTKPFDRCLLVDDNKGLAALKKCYLILIENLPSNHLTTLVRLQDVAIIPEEIVDSIVPSPSAEIGNKMIINYLIGLIHTEEHIITFCYFAERMLGDFDKSICVLNLKNIILMLQKCERINDDANGILTAKTDKNLNVLMDISCDELKTQYADQPDIRALIKAEKPSIFYQPFLHNCGSMVEYSKCLLINSHGLSHSDNMHSSSIEIMGDVSSSNSDMETVKDYIKRDYLKEYAFSLSDGQGIQLSRQQCFESIEILFKESVRGAVMIYYTGCGEEGTGNWCFKDGVISFTDILSLYDKYLKERLLTIYADCSYSGQWVLDYASYLDEMGIEACGHQLVKQKKLLKIFTSCRPNQKVNSKSYATKALNFNEKDDSLWVYTNIELSPGQKTYGCNFSQSQCLNLGGPSAPCQILSIPSRFRWNWRDIVDVERDNRPGSRVFTVRGKDKGREAWHIVLVEKDLLESFRETVSSGTVDVAKFGYVIKSGWGKDPPDDIIKLLKKNG